MTARRAGAAVAGLLLVPALAACAAGAANRPSDVVARIAAESRPASPAPAASVAALNPCPDARPEVASYDPLPSLPTRFDAGSLMATIVQRGYLLVGVSGDTRQLGARESLTDPAPSGLDIEVAKAVGRALLGSDGPDRVRFKVITAGDRFSQANKGAGADGAAGGVDLVARVVSITCDRWTNPDLSVGSAFSVAYLKADQRVLVRKGIASLDAVIAERRKQTGDRAATARVCAPKGSTSLAKILNADLRTKGVTAVPVAIHSDCLALWQQGEVDAITGDDVILAGFLAQDRTAVMLPGKLDTTYAGLAVARAHPEFVRYLNTVMATPQFRSAWTAAYQRYLQPALGDQALPTPVYGRPLP